MILTACSDYKTDTIIQNSLRQELQGDVSLITVAHRLQTIMDADKIVRLVKSYFDFNLWFVDGFGCWPHRELS